MWSDAAIYVGWDWGTENHEVCVLGSGGVVLQQFSVRHTGEDLIAARARLIACAEDDPSQVAVAIETPHGAVVDTLLEGGVAVHSINPKQLDRFRDRFTVAGAKDDRLDAKVLADSLRTDGHLFRLVESDHPWTIELREWSRMREDLVKERLRHTNRLRQQLHRYFPQALELTSDLSVRWFLELLKKVPTHGKAKTIRKTVVSALLKKYGARRMDGPKALQILRKKSPGLAKGTVEAASANVSLTIERLQVVNTQIRTCESRLETLLQDPMSTMTESDDDPYDAHADVKIVLSAPGIAWRVAGVLLAEAGRLLRARNYRGLRALGGVAPVTRASGKQRGVHMRYACHRRLRSALLHWAGAACRTDPWAKAAYEGMRARGQTHSRALRGIADRQLKVLVSMLRNQTEYDPARRAA
jgi:transposase|tara:strand:+ start:435 stop:1676 length:1242 start_codon:yes stop_codon:yes gene_type:complete